MRKTMRAIMGARATAPVLPSSENTAVSDMARGFSSLAPAAATPTRPQLSTQSSSADASKQTDPGMDPRSRLPREELEALDKPVINGWYIAKVVLRVSTTGFAVTMVPVQINRQPWMSISYPDIWSFINDVLQYVLAAVIMSWNSAEFITMCFRKGRGISAKAHIFLDAFIFLLALAAVGYQIFILFLHNYADLAYYQAAIPLTALSSLFHFILSIRGCIDNAFMGSTPRIMYLITGEPVVVLPGRRAPRPTHEADTRDVEMNVRSSAAFQSTTQTAMTPLSPDVESAQRAISPTLPPNTANSPSTSHPVLPTLNTEMDRGDAPPWTPSPHVATADASSPETMAVATALAADGFRDHASPVTVGMPAGRNMSPVSSPSTSPAAATPGRRQRHKISTDGSRPRRKPVPRRKGTHYADPWGAPGPDYEPDEAEKLRAERGERQAQWMSLEGMGVGSGVSAARQRLGSVEEPKSHERAGSDADRTKLPPVPSQRDSSQAADAVAPVVDRSSFRQTTS
ncbi:hypothetical protein MCOR27_006433 [Pyricularia oryzae]|uniref:Uncharacterized protein n=1 Tax=Pyricularia grisea TaxID=148305 RepID=A0ABQ8NHJ8_PYRGI|nr:hypothetical protein MCOR19_004744 [Pyricularia oryzae]KAI6297197.1 hypothetical protein MCOR33_006398 [Pyricularia grisea]KAI6273195.1 hypothetical protein MCOR26_007000 [Pyricularia oryzae]KAI6276540.1 hypothetical protein MCOR27_006433 [Pyricularia oryzae]KAI6319727.1 hypothetical protein MCOR29_005496 [Pyricularia oryzae]